MRNKMNELSFLNSSAYDKDNEKKQTKYLIFTFKFWRIYSYLNTIEGKSYPGPLFFWKNIYKSHFSQLIVLTSSAAVEN